MLHYENWEAFMKPVLHEKLLAAYPIPPLLAGSDYIAFPIHGMGQPDIWRIVQLLYPGLGFCMQHCESGTGLKWAHRKAGRGIPLFLSLLPSSMLE